MPRPSSVAHALSALLGLTATAAAPAQSPPQAAIPLTVTANVNPPALVFQWPADATATGYTVAKRLSGAPIWGTPVPVPGGGGATGWTDALILPGDRHEYMVQKNGSPQARTFVTAGVEALPIETRGKVILLVDGNHVAGLGSRLDRLIEDLVGDGWSVLRHDVPPTDTVPMVKARILADVAAHPGQVRLVFVLGHVAVPYSGNINPDGHPDHLGAWAADVFYGELNGSWTDSSVNNATATRLQNRNTPGDGKYDQSSLPSDVELGVGRVDFAAMPSFAQGELALLQQYLDKDHAYRQRQFTVDQRAVIDDNFGWFGGEAFAASGWRNFHVLVGPGNAVAGDYFTTLNTTTGNGHAWSYGCGGGSYTSAGGIGSTANFVASSNRGVFTMLFGSYFGDWDSTDNFLRAALCSGWTLTNAWAGRPHWSFHPMALGETIGHCARYSQNDTWAGGYGARWVHVGLMGDPTLRQHMIAPPQAVAVTDLWPVAQVSWTASADPVAGYHVYRSASPKGPFTRLTQTPQTATSFADPAALSGPSTYMVRALRLENTPSGSYWNLSQGAFATQTLPQLAAGHQSYGQGCYTISDSCQQFFGSAAAASMALNGRAVQFVPQQGGYLVGHSTAVFVPPGPGATALVLGDDQQVAVSLAGPFPYPGGSTGTLHVHSNGIVGVAPFSLASPAAAEPNVAALLQEPGAAWYCWHDFAPHEPGSGAVLFEETGGVVYVTWQNVESHPLAVANPSTLQFQFEPATGVVRMVFVQLTAIGTGQATAPSEPFLIGWSPGGPSLDDGGIDLATALPWWVGPDNRSPLQLSASPAPVVTATSGVTVTFTIDHVPARTPGNHLGFVIVSMGQDPAGTPLQALGMAGCRQYLGSLDVFVPFAGTGPTCSTAVTLPPGIPGGTRGFAQAVALFSPGSLGNGRNALGVLASNGIASFVNGF